MRVAVTGSSGFLGGATAALLRAQGHEVVGLSRREGIDIDDAAAVAVALQGCRALIHCAGINRELGDQTYAKVHIEGTRTLLRVAKEAGLEKVVYISFLRARPNCGSPYHESKWEAEELVRASGLEFTIFKPGVIYGPGDHMLDHLSHAFMTFPLFAFVGMGPSQTMRPSAGRDVAAVLLAALHDPRLSNGTFAVNGPEELTLKAAVKRVAGVMDKRPLFFHLPVWTHTIIARICEAVMKKPMVALAQVRILSESLVEALPPCHSLPEDLQPQTSFSESEIRKGLPDPKPFGLRDLRGWT